MQYFKQIEHAASYDVVVCGGGFAGFAAAYSAAREGLRVCIVERNGALGGVGTNCLVNHILGQRHIENGKVTTCVGGLFAQVENRLLQMDGAVDFRDIDRELPPQGWLPSLGIGLAFNNEKMQLLLEQMLQELGVRILYMTTIVDIVKEGDALTGIVVHNKSGMSVIGGSYFVDATGDADICAYAGCELLKGDEDGGLAAASLEMHLENVDAAELNEYMRTTGDVRFRKLIGELKEKGIWQFPFEIFISVMLTGSGNFMINTIRQVGIDGTDADALTRGIIEGRKENFTLFEIAKQYFPGFRNAKIRAIAPIIGIRETNRLVGQYTLTVEDLIEARDFPDSIALSGYGWDMPNPKNPSYQPFHGVKRRSPVTQIPYRCLLPQKIGNLIVAGRCISAEREVLGPIRVMAPCIAMGEAAGIATSLASLDNTSYDRVDTDVLRQKIVEYGGLVDRSQVKEAT